MSTDDAILFERWQKRGDAEAFAEIVSRYSNMVYATCRRVLRNTADAEDAAQECFIELMRARVDPRPTLGPWLHTVAVRRSLDRFKSARRRHQRELDHPQAQKSAHAEPETAELLALIDEAIADLSESQRGVIVGRFLENRTHVDLATVHGISEATIRYRLNKGIEQVRTFLKRRGVSVSTGALAGVMGSQLVEAAPLSMTAALGKLALGGARPSIVPVAVKASVFKALTASKAVGLVAAVVLVAAVAGFMYMTPNSPDEPSGAAVIAADDQEGKAAPQSSREIPANAHVAPVRTVEVISAANVSEKPAPPTAVSEEPQPKPCCISGFIYDERGQGIAGARVSAAAWNSSDYRSMRVWYGETDSSGQYTVSDVLLPESYVFADVSVSAAGFQTDGKRVSIQEGEQLDHVDFKLAAGVHLNARILDRSGKPLPSAAVACRSANTRSGSGTTNYFIAATDGDGAFTMGFRDEGIASLLVVSPDGTESFFPAVPIGSADAVGLQMAEPASLSGLVTRENGVPAANVLVSLIARYAPDGGLPDYAAHVSSWNERQISQAYNRSVTTGQDGTYVFDHIAAVPDLILEFYNPSSDEGGINTKLFSQDIGGIQPGEQKRSDCTLPGKGEMMTIRGRIVGAPSGKPVSAAITYANPNSQSCPSIPIDPSGDGTYELKLTTPGAYQVWARYSSANRDEGRQDNSRNVPWQPGGTVTVDFQLPDPFAMAIRVVDADGQPVQEAKVDGVRGPIYVKSRETDAEGRYGWDGFAPGAEAHFTISKDGYLTTESQWIKGESSMTYPEETIVLYASAGLEGVALTQDGSPIALGQIIVTFESPDFTVRTNGSALQKVEKVLETDAAGAFATPDGFPAVESDVTLKWTTPSNEVLMARVNGVQCLPAVVINIGQATLEPVDAPAQQ